MLGFCLDLAKVGGRIAREHFMRISEREVSTKGHHDYVTHVDKLVEDTLVRRIRAHYPNHQILGEEGGSGGHDLAANVPLWIIDPIDGTTNFIRGIPFFCISIAYVEQGEPRHAVVYDPLRDEAFTAERGAGLWMNGQRSYTSNCTSIDRALLATAMPYRNPQCQTDCLRVFDQMQRACDDQRRSGSAALDLAYTAIGRLDGYYELGIYPWDTAAGELLVRCGGGAVTDYAGRIEGLISRRSVVAGASPALHRVMLEAVQPLRPWLDQAPFTGLG